MVVGRRGTVDMAEHYCVLDNPANSGVTVWADLGITLEPGEWFAFPFAGVSWSEIPVGASGDCVVSSYVAGPLDYTLPFLEPARETDMSGEAR